MGDVPARGWSGSWTDCGVEVEDRVSSLREVPEVEPVEESVEDHVDVGLCLRDSASDPRAEVAVRGPTRDPCAPGHREGRVEVRIQWGRGVLD